MRTKPKLAELLDEIKNDLPTYVFIMFHVFIALFCGIVFKRWDIVEIHSYVTLWIANLIILIPSIGILSFGVYLAWKRPKSPFETGRALLRTHVDGRLVAGLVLSVALMFSMGAYTSLKNMMATFNGFDSDLALADFDAMLHAGDVWRLFPEALWRPWILRIIEINYSLVWIVYVVGVACAVAMLVHNRTFRLRFMVCYLAVWAGLGNGIAALFLSAGPAFFKEVAGDGERFQELIQRLSATDGMVHSARGYQHLLWSFYQHQNITLGSGISAFPSIHVAMVTLYCFFIYEINRTLGHIALAYLIIIQVSSVLLGWHYAIDGYASMGAVALIYYAVRTSMNARPIGNQIFARPRGLGTL